jgi:hypothetical protein
VVERVEEEVVGVVERRVFFIFKKLKMCER